MYYKIIDGNTVYSNGKFLETATSNIINPTEQQMLDAGWEICVDPEPTAEESLLQAKYDKIQQIENYDASASVEQFTINDTPMWLGHELRQQIRTSAEAYTAMGSENMTKVFNGAEFTFPIATWIQMLNALEVYAAEALNTTERHKNAVMQLDSIEAVADYDYTANYPTKLQF